MSEWSLRIFVQIFSLLPYYRKHRRIFNCCKHYKFKSFKSICFPDPREQERKSPSTEYSWLVFLPHYREYKRTIADIRDSVRPDQQHVRTCPKTEYSSANIRAWCSCTSHTIANINEHSLNGRIFVHICDSVESALIYSHPQRSRFQWKYILIYSTMTDLLQAHNVLLDVEKFL